MTAQDSLSTASPSTTAGETQPPALLHVYAQPSPKADAFLIGTHAGLVAVRDAINKALQEERSTSSLLGVQSTPYPLRVACVEDVEMPRLIAPWPVESSAKPGESVAPSELFRPVTEAIKPDAKKPESWLKLDEKGCATEATLHLISTWPMTKGYARLLRDVGAVVKRHGWFAHEVAHYSLDTGGWPGNEQMLIALQQNTAFWSMCWRMSSAGGHHRFLVPMEML